MGAIHSTKNSRLRFENFVGTNGSQWRPVSFHSSLSKKMADVVLLVSELEDYFDFINVVVEDDDRLNAC